MKRQDGMFNPHLLTSSILLIMLLAGCAQSPQSCPPPVRIDSSEVDTFADDDSLPFRFPLDDYKIYQPLFMTNFAAKGTSLAYEGKYHTAEDVSHPAGTPVYAMANGNISFSGPMGGYGWLIIIDHPQANLYSLYGHLSPSRWRIESGTVEKGELIAYLGDTNENGSSSKYGQLPPHLHFGVRAGQRADYPGTGIGEWRWQAGWTKPCPQDLGWLQPSAIITSQDIPVGGFPEPAAGLVAKWGGELLLTGFFLFSGVCMLVSAIRKNKPFVLVLSCALLFAVGWILYSKGSKLSYVLFATAILFAAIGIYKFIRRSTKTQRKQS
jgi:hypothetical protein